MLKPIDKARYPGIVHLQEEIQQQFQDKAPSLLIVKIPEDQRERLQVDDFLTIDYPVAMMLKMFGIENDNDAMNIAIGLRKNGLLVVDEKKFTEILKQIADKHQTTEPAHFSNVLHHALAVAVNEINKHEDIIKDVSSETIKGLQKLNNIVKFHNIVNEIANLTNRNIIGAALNSQHIFDTYLTPLFKNGQEDIIYLSDYTTKDLEFLEQLLKQPENASILREDIDKLVSLNQKRVINDVKRSLTGGIQIATFAPLKESKKIIRLSLEELEMLITLNKLAQSTAKISATVAAAQEGGLLTHKWVNKDNDIIQIDEKQVMEVDKTKRLHVATPSGDIKSVLKPDDDELEKEQQQNTGGMSL